MTRDEWFGVPPDGWLSAPLGYYFDVALGKMLNASKDPGDGNSAPYLAAGSIQPEHLILDETKTMAFSREELVQYALRKHDVVVVEGGAGYGRSYLLRDDLPGWGFQNHVARLRGRGPVAPGFLLYCLKACLASGYIEANNRTATLPSLSRDALRSIPVPMPPLEEQRAIADYLDRETARIDTLIEEQQRLIEMLRERRESVITRTVTRGLKPGIPTTDAGVATLDHVPQHWQIVRIKNVGRALIGLTYAPEDVVDEGEGGTLVLRAGNIQNGRLALGDNVYVNGKVPTDLRLRLGDIVICARNGSPKLIGKNAVATEAVVGQTWGAFMVVLRSPINGYLRWVLNSQIFRSQTGLFSTATINQLTSATLHNLRFALPPADEQRRIAAYLDEQTAKIDMLIEESGRFVELARERRAALITAAVTGQIDVREVA
ncbi:restriction endonuclease subunit S [Micromonospora sp. FIMYZ51]|uniref:restriction endonuclease subunit S n=1 Tax=Micromonospora sp. FIMYZ51 TaxID=3051832 RepID=UPI00311FC59B